MNARTKLALMGAIIGGSIPQKPRKVSQIYFVKEGNLNKICAGCGHKNKKCSCNKF